MLATLTAACVIGPEPRFAKIVATGEYCPPHQALDSPGGQRGVDAPDKEASAVVLREYTTRELDTARAIGALDLVEHLSSARERGASEAEIADLRGQLYDAISVARLDISSAVAHLSCEEGRASQIASDLRAAEQAQTRNLTAYSLVLSAAAAIAGGILAVADKNSAPAGVVGIGGGVAGGAFGFATLAVHRTTEFRHAPNILGELWTGLQHRSYPEVVWAYLTRPQFTRSGDRTVRDGLILSWKQSGRLGDDAARPSPSRTALYFGEGGVYDADGLDDRANMLSEVRELVSLMTYDLQHLATESARR
jgi:hypothetical protein